jgi:SAM-dependent methyltransferase
MSSPRLYTELADWWPVISPTSDYADEAAFFTGVFKEGGVKTILELGSGGGSIAWYLKEAFHLTLTDASEAMLAVSKKQNPECEHIGGDMRSLRLGRTFDAVFIHDAIMYMQTEGELLSAFTTAALHCRQGGIVVVVPDCTWETFREGTHLEGHDMPAPDTRSVRYIEWVTDPDPSDTMFDYDFVFALRDGNDIRTLVDRQRCGVFPRATWLALLDKAGFDARAIKDTSTAGQESERVDIFVGHKR